MTKKDKQKTKIKILDSAEKLFARKGFDGTRVDEIAEDAGVNKALIYYYFKSKRDILGDIFTGLIEEALKMMTGSVENIFSFDSEEDTQQALDMFYDFIESKKDIIKIMMMESLKASKDAPPLFRFSHILMSDEADKIKEFYQDKGLNLSNIDTDEALVADFFTGLMPLMSFVVYHDKWSEYFHIDQAELKKKFFEVFQITHTAFHKAQLMRMKEPASDALNLGGSATSGKSP